MRLRYGWSLGQPLGTLVSVRPVPEPQHEFSLRLTENPLCWVSVRLCVRELRWRERGVGEKVAQVGVLQPR